MVTITYNANGGKGEMKPQAVESGVEVKLNANTFTKDGSDFTGWNEAKDGSGKAYADGATVTPTGNLTLYAQWQVKSTPENPGTEDPGTEDPDPENPGTEDPDPEQPGDGESDVDLQLTAGTAVFDAASGLKLPFTVGNIGALTQDELTQLLASATKTVTLFTADNEAGTQVDANLISHGVDGSTPYILVATVAFPQDSETVYSKIEVVLQAEGYVTQTLPYANVSVNPEQPGGGESDVDLQLTEGTAVFNKTTGLTLSFGEGQSLPNNVNASASVSLGETQVNSEHVSFNTDRNAVIVELEALTNDTVGMTVTVTVSADGYNDAVLTYEGVSTVWIPDGVTATFDGTEKIGGESVSVTISQADGADLSGVTIDSGTYSVGESAAEPLTINADRLSFTAPILQDAKDTGTEVTVSLVLAKANATDTVTVGNLALKVYPETHVRFDGKFYALAQGFDFTSGGDLAGVTYDSATISSGISEEGFTFTVPTNDEKKQITIPSAGLNDAVLTLIEMKWNKTGANVYIAQGDAAYGWSPYKGNKTFMLGFDRHNTSSGKWNAKNGSSMNITPGTGSFNKYFILDDGSNLPTLGFNNNTPYKTTEAITSKTTDVKKITGINPLNITFTVSETTNVTYTLKTVAFYTAP